MNLGKAKTILIIAFLGLNLFLGYHLYWPYLGQLTKTVVPAAELQQALAYLAANNYNLNTDIGRNIQKSTFLTVTPAQQGPEGIRDLFNQAVSSTSENGLTVYRGPGRVMTVHPGGQIQVEFQPGLFVAEQGHTLEERELSRLVQHQLREKFFLPEQLRFDYIEKARADERRLTLHFYRDIDGMPLFACYFKVFLEQDFITALEIYWLDPLEQPREGEMEVIPATDALIKLVDELGPAMPPRTITKVDLGYFSREYNAEKWEVPPVWRILMEDNSVYYINAFTGNLEADL